MLLLPLHCNRTLVERLIGARLVYKRANMSRLISFEYLNRQLVWQELSEFLLFLLPLINVAALRRFVLKLLPRVPAFNGGGSGVEAAGAGAAAGLPQGYPVADKQLQQMLRRQQLGGDKQQAAAGSGSSSSTQPGQQPQQGQQQEQQQQEEPPDSQPLVDAAALLRPVGPCGICGIADILLPYVAHPCRHVFCYYCLRGHCEADQGFGCPLDGRRVEAMQRYVRRVPLT